MSHFVVVYSCEDTHGTADLIADDRSIALEAAHQRFPGCMVALMKAEEEEDRHDG